MLTVPHWQQIPNLNELSNKEPLTLLLIALILFALAMIGLLAWLALRERGKNEKGDITNSLVDLVSQSNEERRKAEERAEKRDEQNRLLVAKQIEVMNSMDKNIANTSSAIVPVVHQEADALKSQLSDAAVRNFDAIKDVATRIKDVASEIKQFHDTLDKFTAELPPLIKDELKPFSDGLIAIAEKLQRSQEAADAAKQSNDAFNQEIRAEIANLRASFVDLASKLASQSAPASNNLTVTVSPAPAAEPPSETPTEQQKR